MHQVEFTNEFAGSVQLKSLLIGAELFIISRDELSKSNLGSAVAVDKVGTLVDSFTWITLD